MNHTAQDHILEKLRTTILAQPQKLLIGGHWQSSCSGETYHVINPSNGTPFASAAVANVQDVALAVSAARQALDYGPWATTRPAERTRLLWRLADLIEAHADELALLEVLNTGKPLKIARHFDIAIAIENIRYFAGWATKIGGITHPMSQPGEWHGFTLREPVGVVGQIVAFNVPLAMAASKLAPALAAGCTIILKCAEQTPLTALRLGELACAAGFPPGVINILTGVGPAAGEALVAHPDVDKISFTGSTRVGKAILTAAGSNLKRVTLELGGKSPVIIYPDADLDAATEAATLGIFGNTGQVCAAGSRLFVHRSVFDRVIAGIAERAGRLKVAPGLEPDADIGPVISRQQQERVLGYLDSARTQGANIVFGGQPIPRQGFFVPPTILSQTTPAMTVMREEIFGPVLCAMPFNDESMDEMARLANDTIYGLSASIWTRDLSTAHKMARRIKAGSIKVNASSALDPGLPFGGFKQSGWGRENAREGIEAYTEVKTVAIRL